VKAFFIAFWFVLATAVVTIGQEKTPVLVELFTSEGCSSCPPADALLRDLQDSQPVAGALIVPIGLHVDYWNYAGWTDRFSSPQFSRRQEGYARQFGQGPYTPQMVVDGINQLVGSDRHAAQSAMVNAARTPKTLRILLQQDKAKLRVLVEGPRVKKSDVVLAITEDNVETKVLRGENGGKVLRHAAVAREWKVIGTLSEQRWERELPVHIPAGANAANLHAIIFVQSRDGGQILGIAAIPLQAAN
jgi:hypothetical protein